MLLWVAIIAFQVLSVQCAPGPCEDGTKFFSNAASCPNTKGDVPCAVFFKYPNVTNPVVNGGPSNGTSHPDCLTKSENQTLTCAKQCGLCCQLKEYNCDNPRVNALNCSVYTQKDCEKAALRPSLVKWCPNVCGFCADNGCIDYAKDCSTQAPSICFGVDTIEWAEENCMKTCDKCAAAPPTIPAAPTTKTAATVATTKKPANPPAITTKKVVATTKKVAPPPANVNCIDADYRCPSWNKNGYCSSTYTTTAAKKRDCAKTCNLC